MTKDNNSFNFQFSPQVKGETKKSSVKPPSSSSSSGQYWIIWGKWLGFFLLFALNFIIGLVDIADLWWIITYWVWFAIGIILVVIATYRQRKMFHSEVIIATITVVLIALMFVFRDYLIDLLTMLGFYVVALLLLCLFVLMHLINPNIVE